MGTIGISGGGSFRGGGDFCILANLFLANVGEIKKISNIILAKFAVVLLWKLPNSQPHKNWKKIKNPLIGIIKGVFLVSNNHPAQLLKTQGY